MTHSPPSAGAPLDEWLRWQERLHPQPIAMGLERVRAVAARLSLPAPISSIVVGGTNGKGSSTALLGEIYRAAGQRVGVYTSPHLRRYNERVAIDGVAVPDAHLIRAFAAIEQVRSGTPLTYFEFGTLAALWLFREAGVTLQVLEVGLGGRLDAVNIVDADSALVTSIGIDHVEYLGGTRESIGAEKAGILRPGRPAVCADPEPPASLTRHAADIGTPLWQIGRDFTFGVAADTWHWRAGGTHYRKLPAPRAPGTIQYRNAAGVIAIVTRLQPVLPVAESAIRTGLARAQLPGRFERRGDFVLDVAHNVDAARVLADNLRPFREGGIRIVVGMLSDKPVEGFCAVLAPLARQVYAGGLPPPRGLGADALAPRVRAAAPDAVVLPTVAEAWRRARRDLQRGETLVACGSFLTVAAVAELLDG